MIKSLGLVAFVMICALQAGSASARGGGGHAGSGGHVSGGPVFVPGQASNPHHHIHNKAEWAARLGPSRPKHAQAWLAFQAGNHSKAFKAAQAANQRPVFVPSGGPVFVPGGGSQSRLH
jgi:hypothetical protein